MHFIMWFTLCCCSRPWQHFDAHFFRSYWLLKKKHFFPVRVNLHMRTIGDFLTRRGEWFFYTFRFIFGKWSFCCFYRNMLRFEAASWINFSPSRNGWNFVIRLLQSAATSVTNSQIWNSSHKCSPQKWSYNAQN